MALSRMGFKNLPSDCVPYSFFDIVPVWLDPFCVECLDGVGAVRALFPACT